MQVSEHFSLHYLQLNFFLNMLGVQLPSPETRGLARLRDQGRGEGGRPHVDLRRQPSRPACRDRLRRLARHPAQQRSVAELRRQGQQGAPRSSRAHKVSPPVFMFSASYARFPYNYKVTFKSLTR